MNTDLAIARQRLKATMATLPYKVGVLMVAFTKDRFKYQNWLDTYPVAWPRRKKNRWSNKGKTPNDAGRALLVKSGRLRRATRIVSTTPNSVTIGNDTPYAAVHNNGERMKFTQNVDGFVRMNKKRDGFSAVKGKEGKRSTRVKFVKTASGISNVKAHKRSYNYKMPQRQFMGESKYLNMQIKRLISAEINKIFN